MIMLAHLANGKLLFSLLMLAIFVVMVTIALGYPPQSRMMPLVIGIPGILFTLILVVEELRGKGAKAETPADGRSEYEKYQDEINRFTAPDRKVDLDIVHEAPQLVIEEGPSDPAEIRRREIVLFSYFVGVVAGVVLFGFWLTIPVFLVTFLRFHEGDSWRLALTVTGVTLIAIYLVFEKAMHMFLFDGLITDTVLDMIFGI